MRLNIRSQFSLVTACLLIGLLLCFYIGGRLIIVQMLRQAEDNIRAVGSDIKHVVFDELSLLQRATERFVATVNQAGLNEISDDLLQQRLAPTYDKHVVNFVALLSSDGTFNKGYFRSTGSKLRPIESGEVVAYFSPEVSQTYSLGSRLPLSGLICFDGQPLLLSSQSLVDSDNKLQGFVVLGSLFNSVSMWQRITNVTHGMDISFPQRITDKSLTKSAVPVGKEAQLPKMVFKNSVIFGAGGNWHLGENNYETVLPLNDIFGSELSSISVRMPQSFASLTSIALGWLTSFTAAIGIVFVLPIFWVYTRILLNHLTNFSEQVAAIKIDLSDEKYPELKWDQDNEFGVLATSINKMLSVIASHTAKIKQQEAKVKALISGVPDCLCLMDREARIVTLNKQPDYTHPIPGLVQGQRLSRMIFPDTDCDAMQNAVATAFATNSIQLVMICCRETDGSYRHFESRISRFDEKHALVVIRDVTKEWRERESREVMESNLARTEKMESLSTLAAGIAHDVNNVLAIIQNTVEVTWADAVPEGQQEAVDAIIQATGKGSSLARELMTYAGQTTNVFKRDNPNNVILDMEQLMSRVVDAKISLDIRLHPELPDVAIDPHQFWKVILNLLKNASEAMQGASGKITLRTYPLAITPLNANKFFSTQTLSFGNGVIFQVDDTGCGISKSVIDRMFEPFYSTKSVGRGLGLSTVFGIVDAHNGGVAISSVVGKGTTFKIWLPVAPESSGDTGVLDTDRVPQGDLAIDTADSGHETVLLHDARFAKILLVEDDVAIVRTAKLLLRSLKLESLAATTQREALSLFSKHAENIPLVLLDAQIGTLDNVKLLNMLKRRNPKLHVVIVSGYEEEYIRKTFADAAYDLFLKKPYTRDELKRALSQFIRLVP